MGMMDWRSGNNLFRFLGQSERLTPDAVVLQAELSTNLSFPRSGNGVSELRWPVLP